MGTKLREQISSPSLKFTERLKGSEYFKLIKGVGVF